MEGINCNVLQTAPYQGISSTPINVGDISSIMIKERTGSDEAKVILKGQEMSVKFDGPMPSDDRVLVEVKQQNENGQFVLRPILNETVSAQSADELFKKAGFDLSTQPQLKEAVKFILAKGGRLSNDDLINIQAFLKNNIGSFSEKLETIKVMQHKNLEFTKTQLNAINIALHGKNLMDSMSELVDGPIKILKTSQEQHNRSVLEHAMAQMKDNPEQILRLLDPSEDQQLITDLKKALQIQAAGKDQILQAITDSSLKETLRQEPNLQGMINQLKINGQDSILETALHNAQKLENIGEIKLEAALQQVFSDREIPESPSNTSLQDTIKLIQKEPSMEKVLDGIRTFLEENGALDVSGVQLASEKAGQLVNTGREMAARKELVAAMTEFQENNPKLQKPNSDQGLSKMEQYLINESVQSFQLDSKNILVTQITKKLSQMAIDFKQVKREMSRNLDTASRLMEGNKLGSVVPVKQMLEATIHKLDQTILKSNFMLYTDMTTEKKMLTASSKLAEAKSHLDKGNVEQANQLVKEVKEVVDKFIFKPSDNRVKHFISQQDLLTPKGMLEKAIRPFPDHESGARGIFETVKSMGLTHENESTQALVDKKDLPQNLKSVLIQMLQADSGQARVPLEQALANITGQQLLNKPDSSGFQNFFMQLPILLNTQVENVKVFVNSQKKKEKIDWENCSLYFVLDTKKLGEVGISVSAVNRNLSITFNNNKISFQEKAEPLIETAKERLREIGFHVSSLQFAPFNTEPVINNGEKRASHVPAFTEKGYDFSI